jgi:hypothetical protein
VLLLNGLDETISDYPSMLMVSRPLADTEDIFSE